tara:strand:+ start:9414 stop:9659 length:246 start_codon:yes stop_codon:yes gene_type:complete
MGWLFKTPSDDATEATLRAMHIANELDNAYERVLGWVKVLVFGTIAVFVVSAFEHYTDWNLWESTGDWLSDWAIRQLEKLV